MKHHPYFRNLLSGSATRLAYGARTLNEGGLQSVPKLNFPGGALIGCAAGFVNLAKIKGTHNAMKSGMLAAEAAFDALPTSTHEKPSDMSAYDTALHNSWVHTDLKEVRNMRPSFNTALGLWGGMAYSGLDSMILRGRTPWTFHHRNVSDAGHTMKASGNQLFELPIGEQGKVIVSQPKDKVYQITFSSPPDNRLTSVSLRVKQTLEIR